MTDTDILPAPNLHLMSAPPSKFEVEKAAFYLLMPDLLKEYRNKYVAIHEEKVVGSGDDIISVAMAAYRRFGYQPIYVDLVTDGPLPLVRVPYFKILSPR